MRGVDNPPNKFETRERLVRADDVHIFLWLQSEGLKQFFFQVVFERLLTWPHGASCQINNSQELGTNPSIRCRQPVSPTADLNQTGKCKPCKEQGFRIAPSAVHDGMSDFQSV